MKWASEHGLTRVHSAGGDFEVLDLYDELRRHGDLTVRFYIAYFLDPPRLRPRDLDAIEDARKKFQGDWIDAGAVKFMVDGVIESHTAAMLEPYADDPSIKGKLFWEPSNYKAAVAELDKRDLQLFTHAIGEYGSGRRWTPTNMPNSKITSAIAGRASSTLKPSPPQTSRDLGNSGSSPACNRSTLILI